MPGRFSKQMTDHILDPVRGPQVGHRLEYYAPAASGQSWNRGAVISANNKGELIAGCPAGSSFNRPMPMYAIQSSDDLDVWYDNDNVQRYGTGAPEGRPSSLVASGGFELATTEFEIVDASNSNAPITYNVNDQLTCDENGKLILKTAESQPTVGIVSQSRTNLANRNELKYIQERYARPVLFFWTFFIPAVGSSSSSSSSSSN